MSLSRKFTLLGCLFLVVAMVIPRVFQEIPEKKTTTMVYNLRSDAEMKYFEQKLTAVQPGDLLVMVDAQANGAPSIEKVVGVEVGGFATQGVPEGWTPPGRPMAYYINFHKNRGAVHIIPTERVESFYTQVGSAAFMQEVH